MTSMGRQHFIAFAPVDSANHGRVMFETGIIFDFRVHAAATQSTDFVESVYLRPGRSGVGKMMPGAPDQQTHTALATPSPPDEHKLQASLQIAQADMESFAAAGQG